MKGNKIDEIFRNGLESHKTPPPSTAWDKIESQLPTKSKKGIYFWFNIAASILLVFVFGWLLIINNGKSSPNIGLEASQNEVVKEPALDKGVNPKEDLEIVLPEKSEKENLMVASDAPKVLPQKEENPVQKTQEKSQDVYLSNAEESSDQKNIHTTEQETFIEIELIKLDPRSTPRFFIAEKMSEFDFMKDISIDMESYLNSHQTMTAEPVKRKKFSLLSGIVSVAKGVNKSKLTLSEIRKSKNDFFISDLKYGNKEAEAEEIIDEDLDEK